MSVVSVIDEHFFCCYFLVLEQHQVQQTIYTVVYNGLTLIIDTFSMLSNALIFNFPSLYVTMSNNFKLSEKVILLLFTSNPNIGYEINEAGNI